MAKGVSVGGSCVRVYNQNLLSMGAPGAFAPFDDGDDPVRQRRERYLRRDQRNT